MWENVFDMFCNGTGPLNFFYKFWLPMYLASISVMHSMLTLIASKGKRQVLL